MHCEAERGGIKGLYVPPVIFTNAKPDMKIMREEIFGPVAVIIKFEDEQGKPCFHAPF